eukprot:6189084-Pleurochrysis_carterae.AAC.2
MPCARHPSISMAITPTEEHTVARNTRAHAHIDASAHCCTHTPMHKHTPMHTRTPMQAQAIKRGHAVAHTYRWMHIPRS